MPGPFFDGGNQPPMIARENNFENFTIAEVHQHVVKANNITEAAASLGVHSTTLSRYLAQPFYQGQPLAFEDFNKLSVENAKANMGAAYQLTFAFFRNLSNAEDQALLEETYQLSGGR